MEVIPEQRGGSRTLNKVCFPFFVFTAQAFKIEIFPESKIVAQIGDSVSLTCSTTGCEPPSFSWRTQIDSPLNGKVRNEGANSTLIMDPISFENEHSYLCTATCGSRKLEKGNQVEIYCEYLRQSVIFLKFCLKIRFFKMDSLKENIL